MQVLQKLFFSPATEPFERNHVLVGALSVFILSNNIAIE
jgi:predicted MFS family arabinose efflux permease